MPGQIRVRLSNDITADMTISGTKTPGPIYTR